MDRVDARRNLSQYKTIKRLPGASMQKRKRARELPEEEDLTFSQQHGRESLGPSTPTDSSG